MMKLEPKMKSLWLEEGLANAFRFKQVEPVQSTATLTPDPDDDDAQVGLPMCEFLHSCELFIMLLGNNNNPQF